MSPKYPVVIHWTSSRKNPNSSPPRSAKSTLFFSCPPTNNPPPHRWPPSKPKHCCSITATKRTAPSAYSLDNNKPHHTTGKRPNSHQKQPHFSSNYYTKPHFLSAFNRKQIASNITNIFHPDTPCFPLLYHTKTPTHFHFFPEN